MEWRREYFEEYFTMIKEEKLARINVMRGKAMRNGLILLSLLSIFCLAASGCGHSEGSSSIVGGGGTPEGGGGTFGASKWSADIKGKPSGTQGPTVIPTFISSPALAPDGTVYVGSTDHFLYALNPDGTVKWKYETGNSLFASPAIGSDGTIYIGSEDRQIYAINPDGTLRWIRPTKSVFTSSAAIGVIKENGKEEERIYVAGTGADQTIFPCSDGTTVTAQLGNLYALAPNGDIKWTFGLSGDVHSSPAIASDGTIYIGTNGDIAFDRSNICDNKSAFLASDADPSAPAGGHVYAINPNGTLKWDFKTLGATASSPAIGSDGTIYIGSDRPLKFFGKDHSTLLDQNPTAEGFLTAINPDGTLKCFVDLFGDVNSSPAVNSDGTIYVGSDDNHVWALNPNCSVKWKSPTRDLVRSSPAIATDGTIFIGSNDGSLYAFSPDDGTEKLRFVSAGAVNSSPAIGSDGKVYFASASSNGNNVESSTINAIVGTNSGLAESPWPKFRHDLPNIGRK